MGRHARCERSDEHAGVVLLRVAACRRALLARDAAYAALRTRRVFHPVCGAMREPARRSASRRPFSPDLLSRMDIHIAVEGRHDLAGQIYRQLRAGIVEGRLAGGTQLPSTRDLATQLGVSRKTTLDVFERLLSEGYLSARAG